MDIAILELPRFLKDNAHKFIHVYTCMYSTAHFLGLSKMVGIFRIINVNSSHVMSFKSLPITSRVT